MKKKPKYAIPCGGGYDVAGNWYKPCKHCDWIYCHLFGNPCKKDHKPRPHIDVPGMGWSSRDWKRRCEDYEAKE